jgi:hypothetical protein
MHVSSKFPNYASFKTANTASPHPSSTSALEQPELELQKDTFSLRHPADSVEFGRRGEHSSTRGHRQNRNRSVSRGLGWGLLAGFFRTAPATPANRWGSREATRRSASHFDNAYDHNQRYRSSRRRHRH